MRVLELDAGPAEASAAPRRRLTRFRLGPMDGDALRVWLISRLGMVLITWAVIWTGWGAAAKQPRGWASMWQRWDWLRFYDIAAHGYSLRARHGASIAFFPGYPGLLYAVHLIFRSWVYSGLLISLVAGAIAAVALARIIALEAAHLGDSQARSAVRDGLTLFVWAPAAVFLAAGYSEAPFLAFTLWAWLAARRERWMAAGLLLAGAATIRVNGLFVLAAVGVLFLQSRPRTPRAWLRGGWLLVPLLPVAGYMAYLHSLTGNWNAWEHAERVGWNRHLSYPWHTFANTWHYAFGRYLTAHESWEYQLEIAVTLLGIGLVVWLAVKRRWAEFVYALLSVGTLATSHVYLSVPREMLTWWPLWAALAVWCVRRPWVKTVYLTVSAPVMFTVAYLFLTGRWAG
ncbi:mannosyltransferase family protein [Actinocrinis sp.]|uniref:mannosyltransferase family protein n=1 Tax=Actinocrinis sp. TaxID=1920516 RepID=UPI002D68C0CC|nr:mannosyltransferase family protein [Actinocrinis sp.]HZP49856.1 mannosyltransferase family protein [Actinocrinis sp.]